MSQMYELVPHRRHKNKERPSHGKGQPPKKAPKKYPTKPKGKSHRHEKDLPNDMFLLSNEPHHTTSESAFDAYIRNFVWNKMKDMMDDAFLSHLLYILDHVDDVTFRYKLYSETDKYVFINKNRDFDECIFILRNRFIIMLYNEEGFSFSPCMDLYLMNIVIQNVIRSLWLAMTDRTVDSVNEFTILPTKQMEKEQYESHPLRDLIPFERLEDRYDDYSDSDDDW